MDMGHDMGGNELEMPKCVISMLWNWNTIDSCFLASSWHITSRGMFAGSCIGVICLTVCLEFLRRLAREYDAFIIRRARMKAFLSHQSPAMTTTSAVVTTPPKQSTPSPTTVPIEAEPAPAASRTIRPSITEQIIRALLHLLQFAVAYFIMLLAMYFNGYIIISIFIGAFLGSLVFSWEGLGDGPS